MHYDGKFHHDITAALPMGDIFHQIMMLRGLLLHFGNIAKKVGISTYLYTILPTPDRNKNMLGWAWLLQLTQKHFGPKYLKYRLDCKNLPFLSALENLPKNYVVEYVHPKIIMAKINSFLHVGFLRGLAYFSIGNIFDRLDGIYYSFDPASAVTTLLTAHPIISKSLLSHLFLKY